MLWKGPLRRQLTLMNTDRLKMVFGFCLLVMLSGLAAAIALGKVEEKTSYGLPQIITVIGVIAGGFANWAFGNTRDKQ